MTNKKLPPEQPYPWPHGEAIPPPKESDRWFKMPLAVSVTAPLSCEAGPRKPAQCKPEEWVRYDTTIIKPGEFRGWLKENDRAFREHPAVIAAAEREAQRALLDAIPPDGRSTSGRCAPAREPSDTVSDGEQIFNESGEDDVIFVINGQDMTRRELVLGTARARRDLGMPLSECLHPRISPRDGLCLDCGEFIRDD